MIDMKPVFCNRPCPKDIMPYATLMLGLYQNLPCALWVNPKPNKYFVTLDLVLDLKPSESRIEINFGSVLIVPTK